MSFVEEIVREGHPWLALGSLAFLGGAFLAERMLLRSRPLWYFTAGFPQEEMVPIPRPPAEEEGQTAMVHWARRDDVVLFWSQPGAKGAPMGLHGAIRLLRQRGNVRMIVTWSPPWTPMLAAVWLAGLGALRQEWVTAPIACALVFAVLMVYRQAALQAGAELRWSFVKGGE